MHLRYNVSFAFEKSESSRCTCVHTRLARKLPHQPIPLQISFIHRRQLNVPIPANLLRQLRQLQRHPLVAGMKLIRQ